MNKSKHQPKSKKKTQPGARPAPAAKKTDESLDLIVQKLLRYPEITQTRMFGSIGLKTGDKVFAILCTGKFVLKLPNEQVSALVAAGDGAPFEPGHGRVMKGWVAMDPGIRDKWLKFAKKSRAYVASLN
jgi:hypothetical protein